MAHWLRKNERCSTPVRVACLDTESHVKGSATGTDHHFRLAVTSFDVRREANKTRQRQEWADHFDKRSVWEWIAKRCSTRHATWLFAHNLEYDLTVSGGWDLLPELGFEISARASGGTAPWIRWRRKEQSLICADLAGWVQRPLSTIGEWLGHRKFPMPDFTAPDDVWLAYCRRDVEVLREAVLELMRWVDTEDLGNWSYSGAGQGWRVFRHRYMTENLLVHDDPEAQELERHASFGGRREVLQVGKFNDGPYVDVDFRAHYLVTAGRMRLPRKLAGVITDPDPVRLGHWRDTLAVIAEVDVSTELPCVPVRSPAGIIYPVGTFRTALAGPELDLLEELGGTFKARRVAIYLSAPFLVPWARWLYDTLHGDDPEADQLRRSVLKGWSRELIGKFGQRAAKLTRIGEHQPGRDPSELYYPEAGREPVPVVNREDGLFITDRTAPGENAIPSVYAYVTSAARVALWRALDTVGWANVLAMDTDGLLAHSDAVLGQAVQAPGGRMTGRQDLATPGALLDGPEFSHLPGRLVVKDTWQTVEIRSPEAMVLDGRARVAGLPRSAKRIGDWEFTAELWPGADWQLQHRHDADYRTVARRQLIRAGYTRRRVLPDGTTEPWRFSLLDDRNVCPEIGLH